MSSVNDREKKRLQANNEKRLMALVKSPGNTSCCDCGANGPRWASFNIGCFLCIRCGGIHRRMGTHISKVKSISLDSWKEEQIQFMEQWGNTKVNLLYLHNANARSAPKDDEGLEQYIRDKYERKRFFKPGGQVAEPSSTPKAEDTENGAVKSGLKTLYDMGFTNVKANLAALKKSNLNVNTAIELLVNDPNLGNESGTDVVTNQLLQLEAMGFKDRNLNRAKLAEAKGNINNAITMLTNTKNLPDIPKNVNSKASSLLGLDTPQTTTKMDEDDGFGEFASSPKPTKSEVKGNNSLLDEFGDFSFHPQSSNSQPNTEAPVAENVKPVGDKDSIMALFNQAPVQPSQQFGFQPAFSGNANASAGTQPLSNNFSGMTSFTSANAGSGTQPFNNNFSGMTSFTGTNAGASSQSFNNNFSGMTSFTGANAGTGSQSFNNNFSGMTSFTGVNAGAGSQPFNNGFSSSSFNNGNVANAGSQTFTGGFPTQQTFSNNSVEKKSDMQNLNSAFASLDPFAKFSASTPNPQPSNQGSSNKQNDSNLNDLLDLM